MRNIPKLRSGVEIHPTALVHPKAELAGGVTIGPFSIVDEEVAIGEGTEVANHVTIRGPTVIGRDNRFFTSASIGQDPQDKKYQGRGESRLEIGDGNTFREFVTVHRGTGGGQGVTRVGDGNWVMAYCHIAHDCNVGNNTILANGATLGGHVTVQDMALLGGFTAVHQYCTIGSVAMTGGHSMVAQDIPPFVIATGNRVKLFGINKIGLERNGFQAGEIENIHSAYRIYFQSRLQKNEGLERLEADLGHSPAVRALIEFIRNSERGVCR